MYSGLGSMLQFYFIPNTASHSLNVSSDCSEDDTESSLRDANDDPRNFHFLGNLIFFTEFS